MKLFLILTIAAAGLLVAPAPSAGQASGDANVVALLRMRTDSGVVGQFTFTTNESHQLVFDLPADDPRLELLQPLMLPKTKDTKIAVTLVNLPRAESDQLLYLVYWLGYSVEGDEVQSLSPIQWDSIFRAAGRQAQLKLSLTGEPLGVSVTSEAVRPVGQAFALILSGLAVDLPDDSVSAGATWAGNVAIPVRKPDGTRSLTLLRVTYRLRELIVEPDGLYARIEFDGAPVPVEGFDADGRYFGEAMFDVTAGRFDDVVALASIEVEWPPNPEGLPPSHSLTEWRGSVTRARTR